MTKTALKGKFYLAPEIRLARSDQGGVVLQLSPLRVMRVNGAAFDILEKCREGFSPEELVSGTPSRPAQPVLSFIDSLCGAHLLRWTPARNASLPFISIIVPVYNRAHEIGECLESLTRLNYPRSMLEIIVVDDASRDNTASVAREYGVKLIVQERNLGQSAARNAAVAVARGEIVAFIDSDCIADPNWLTELVDYFQDPRIVLVGGFVASHFRKTWLDRYEDARSPLNMGGSTVTCSTRDSDFYVPTCNMLVRKDAYLEVGGLDEAWRVGEDVDLCWKLKKRGHRLVYVPEGRVSHKHRNRLFQTFKRRFDYGTSEPALYDRHDEVSKKFPWQPAGLFFCLSCCLGLLTNPLFFSVVSFFIVLAQAFHNRSEIRKKADVPLAFWEIFQATFKNCYSLAYYLSLHLVRYYLLLIVPLMLLFPSTMPLWLVIVLFPPTVEFRRIRPRLSFPVFLAIFLMEQASYQAGVFAGCVKIGKFRCYRLRLTGARSLPEQVAHTLRQVKDIFVKRRHESAV